jgi:uncharacterized Zn-finger protein
MICSYCKKAFTVFSVLNKHMRIIHEKFYQCDICGEAFTNPSDLKAHERTHRGEKPYDCDQCDKAFTQAVHLKHHKRKHTEE